MKYIFADLKFEINEKYHTLSKEAEDYLGSFDNADFTVSVTLEDLKYEQSISDSDFSEGYLEYIAVLRKIGEILPLFDGFVLHSACFDVDGLGFAFLAPSGTGKTTHLNRWKSHLGERLTIVNGDKPIVRFIDGKPIAYGTPWCGKERLGSNTKTPLKHLCFIKRSDINFVKEVSRQQAVELILNQIYMPRISPQTVAKTMELADRLLSNVRLWEIHCNQDQNAGEIIYKSIFE